MTKILYHLSCPLCGKTWWTPEAFPLRCPYCNASRSPYNIGNFEVKQIER